MNIGPNTSVQEIDQIVSQAPEKERCRVYMAALEALESKGEAAPAELRGRVSSLLLNEKERLTDAFIEKMKGLEVQVLNKDEVLRGKLKLNRKLSKLANDQKLEVLEAASELQFITVLDLSDNKLTSVPDSIGKLTNLTSLYLALNQLVSVPESIGKLTKLNTLDLSDNELASIPDSIGKLTNLTDLYLGSNQFTTIPASVTQLKEIEIMTLTENPLLAEGVHEGEWGRRELIDHFEGRLRIDDPDLVRMPVDTRVEDVLKRLSGINIEGLKECTLPEVPGQAMSCEELLASFEEVVKTLDFDDEGGANYVSYEQLAPDWKVEDDKNNRERIEERLLPKMRGYIKALYGVGLDEDDQRPAMLPYEKDEPEVKKALSYIFRNMQEETDGGINAVRLTQLFNGIFYCHIGQNEALQTIVFGMLGTTVRGDATSVIKHILALKKNEWIQKAVLAKAVGSTQNVHLVNFYRDKLQELLGIVPGKVEPFDKGQDPFSGNEANVLQVFLELFTPERVVQFIRDYTQTLAERTWQRDHFRYLEGKPEKPGPRPTYHPVTNGDLMYLLQKEEYFSPGDFEDPLAVVTDEGLLEVLVQIGILNRMDS